MVQVSVAIAPAAIRLAEALSSIMPGFGQMAMARFDEDKRRELIHGLFERSGIGDRVRS